MKLERATMMRTMTRLPRFHGLILGLLFAAVLPAPARAECTPGPGCWTTGTYQYDGAGNIKAMGSDSFGYDRVNRLESAT
ncbi:MAG TPA: hypothetical protein VM534_02450, partial [Thermoanaerobaculia bacterium]|nr:hypothetical protein [Thermoanaerobaculia bacterium]